MRVLVVATVASWAIAATVIGGCWFVLRPGSDGLAAALLAGFVLASALAGYLLRGTGRRATVVCGLIIGTVPALVTSYLMRPLLHPAWRAAGILLSLVSVWIWIVIPLLVWQGFFQGLLGIASKAEKATPEHRGSEPPTRT